MWDPARYWSANARNRILWNYQFSGLILARNPAENKVREQFRYNTYQANSVEVSRTRPITSLVNRYDHRSLNAKWNDLQYIAGRHSHIAKTITCNRIKTRYRFCSFQKHRIQIVINWFGLIKNSGSPDCGSRTGGVLLTRHLRIFHELENDINECKKLISWLESLTRINIDNFL